MAPRTDRTTRIPSDVAPAIIINDAAKGSVFDNSRNAGNLKCWPPQTKVTLKKAKQQGSILNSMVRTPIDQLV